jgi:hypothetical protein
MHALQPVKEWPKPKSSFTHTRGAKRSDPRSISHMGVLRCCRINRSGFDPTLNRSAQERFACSTQYQSPIQYVRPPFSTLDLAKTA